MVMVLTRNENGDTDMPHTLCSVKKSRTIFTLFLRNSTQKTKKNMSMHITFINPPVLYMDCIQKSYRLHKSVPQATPKK